ncbi:MAG: hypothetical protein LBI60_07160 [Bacteroidales bacterium]|jgi:hypothetical protein|nr:hypothetical protein [Bacteroidales bacterium]
MKKIVLGVMLLGSIITTVNAQPRAIGGRLGGDVEFSYQHRLGKNMIDATAGLGLGYNHLAIDFTAMYDWVFPISSWKQAGKWNWYVGPGAGLGFIVNRHVRIPVKLNLGGQIGVEYQFNFPLNLSLDYRPMINVLGFGNHTWGNFFGIALGIRYRF